MLIYISMNQLQKLYDQQLQTVKELEHVQNVLTYDPNSVMNEKKLESYREEHEKAIQKLKHIEAQLQKMNMVVDKSLQSSDDKIQKYKQMMEENQNNFHSYRKNIHEKMEKVATRDRMLQLSQERNVYKMKMIYVLLAVIIALVLGILYSYAFFSRSK